MGVLFPLSRNRTLRPARALLTGALLCSSSVHAQLDTVEIHLDAITVEDGLPQGYVQAMAQDSTGYLWFGTKDGLARYDGYSFTVFRHNEQDTNSIGGDHISSLLVDREGYLWVGYAPFGLDRYDPRTGRFAHVRVEGLEDGLSSRLQSRLCADGLGRTRISLHTSQGWRNLVVDPNGGAQLVAKDPRSVSPPMVPLVDARVFIGPNDDPWIANPDTFRCIHRSADGSFQVIDRPHKIPWRAQDGVREAPQMVADPATGHMLVAEPGFVTLRVYDQAAPLDTIHLTDQQFQLFLLLDSQRRIWGGPHNGMDRRLDLKSGRTEVVTPSGSVPAGIWQTTGLRPTFEDRAGNVWFTTGGFGVFRTNLRRERFTPVDPGLLKGVYPGNLSGSMLLGFMKDGLNIRYGAPGIYTKVLMPSHGTPPNMERAVVDDQGRIWVGEAVRGTRDIRAAILDDHGLTYVKSLEGERIRDIFPGPGNTIWAVTGTNVDVVTNLTHLDARTGSIIRRYTPPIAFGTSDYLSISSFTHHPDGTVWMGTVAGLHHLDPKTGVWKVYQHDENDPQSLPHDMVFTTCLDPSDPKHVLWVGTNGGGLARFDVRTKQFKTYTTKDGLPNNVIYGILSDVRNNLWIGTNQGLVQFDPRAGAMTTYTKDDGLPSNEFNRYCYAKTDDGELWFEGMGGAFHFDPEEFYEAIPASPTVITGLKLVGKAVAVAGLGNATGEGYELPAPIEYVRSITLPYSERMITFSFACMDHTAPLKNTFRYMLENFSADWVEVGTQHEATFTNLDPGTYTFRVQGRNSAGVWDERGAAMQLIITPPWWGTWWFRIIAALLITGGVVAFYRYRLAQAVKVVRVRERIARDLHDEIGSTLSSVSLFSSVAQKKAAGKAPEASELLGRITDSTTQVLEAMNDIVWAVNADNDDMASVIKRMHAFAVNVTEARGCKLHLHADEELKSWRLEMTQRKNLYLIFKEAVNNAMKYSGCANLHVELVRDKSTIVLRVVDDGSGFDVRNGNGNVGGGNGNGLGNMRNRAAEIPGTLTISSTLGQGTTVELRFTPGESKSSLEPMTPGSEQAQ
ncbi:MAG: hypothetical protein IPN62_18365 [Flavobacteriales bacterium]|nr:hypothetical protein [Flavobacteriales bacterium]